MCLSWICGATALNFTHAASLCQLTKWSMSDWKHCLAHFLPLRKRISKKQHWKLAHPRVSCCDHRDELAFNYSFTFIAATYDVRGMKRGCRAKAAACHQSGSETHGSDRRHQRADRQASTTTDLWSWLWSRESRFPLCWRRGRYTVPQPVRSLHAEIRLHPGKYNVTDKLRLRMHDDRFSSSPVTRTWKPGDVLTRA